MNKDVSQLWDGELLFICNLLRIQGYMNSLDLFGILLSVTQTHNSWHYEWQKPLNTTHNIIYNTHRDNTSRILQETQKKKKTTTGYDNTVIETLLQAIINTSIQYQASDIKSPYMTKSHLTYIAGVYAIPGNKRY